MPFTKTHTNSTSFKDVLAEWHGSAFLVIKNKRCLIVSKSGDIRKAAIRKTVFESRDVNH